MSDIPILGENKDGQVPTIGGCKLPSCSFCGVQFERMTHPTQGEMLSPPCNCSRPIFLGDLESMAAVARELEAQGELEPKPLSEVLGVILFALKSRSTKEREGSL
jgi:hypothetical protein